MNKAWLSLFGLLLTIVGAVLLWHWPPTADSSTTVAPQPALAATYAGQQQTSATTTSDWPPALPTAVNTEGYVPLLPLDQQESASQSLNAARLAGDTRAPALNPAIAEIKASAEELADSKKYSQWQQQQTQVLYRNFIAAAEPEIEKLRTLLATPQGQALSLKDQQKIQRKLSELQTMQQQLQQKLSDKRQ